MLTSTSSSATWLRRHAVDDCDNRPTFMADDAILISDLHVLCVVGCNPDERHNPQPVVVNLQLFLDVARVGATDDLNATVNYALVAKGIVHYCEAAQCYTLEALATGIAHQIFVSPECRLVQRVCVRIDKPKAFRKLPAVPGVQLHRTREFFKNAPGPPVIYISPSDVHSSRQAGATAPQVVNGATTVFLAIGTNLGDRYDNICRALRLLAQPAPPYMLTVVRTSFLYETGAAYVTDQPPFLNAALEVTTTLPPRALLSHIKSNVESALGRPVDGSGLRYGARVIDVDILAYADMRVVCEGDSATDSQALVVPHPRIAERAFVLVPLCDIAPELLLPLHGDSGAAAATTASDLLRRLQQHAAPCVGPLPAEVQRVLPLRVVSQSGAAHGAARRGATAGAAASSTLLLAVSGPRGRTHIMGIINATPDSFSDGGKHASVADATAAGIALATAGAAIVDVGGQSTRPGAAVVPEAEELGRVIPVIAALRAALPPSVAISIDTSRASVARQAVGAGASLINDVTAGEGDPDMIAVAVDLQVRRAAQKCEATSGSDSPCL